ncbi:hypothetical protein [Brevundimonas sp. G8]|uniref:hypothetical protein n=1 Tax=Brevundimonas sp. G8 TaxID=1350776 RepID=UPI0012F004B5|nr:hypothetical protein [Brevundimonas sp. G8]VXB61578.1 membrane hypothetical protein [Brevundimonas sp. G8]
MIFTKEKGNRLIAIILSSWVVCVVTGLMISAVSERRALDAFIVMFAIVVGSAIAAYLFSRDLLSALLLVGGGLIAFAVTVVLATLLGL